MKVVRTHNGIIRKYLHILIKPTISFSLGPLVNIIPRWLFTSPRIANWMGRSWGQLAAQTRGSQIQILILLIFCPHNHRKYWAFIVDFWHILRLYLWIKMRLYQPYYVHSSRQLNLNLVTPTCHMVSTCCLCLKLRLKGVIQPRLISPSLSLAPSKGHRTEQSQSWEGSEPIHIKFSSPSHAWEVLKYFLKYSRMHGVRIMGSTWLSSENGKRCRHCEVQTRHSDLDSTGHWTQVWLHLHLQLNGHSQIYWMTSTVCCLATDKTRTENSENGKGDGKTTRIFFLKLYTFYIYPYIPLIHTLNILFCWFFDFVLPGHKNNVRSRNIIFNYYSNGQTGGGNFILKYIFWNITTQYQ